MADNISRDKIFWLAGLLEGEGCFQLRRGRYCSPFIQLIMIDKDVVIEAAKIMGTHKVIRMKQKTKGGKDIYRTVLYGSTCIALLRKIKPLMGSRRQMKINEIMGAYWDKPTSPYPERKPYSRGSETVWLKEG